MNLAQQYLHRVFSADTRALSFMRIWVASVLLLDILIRLSDLEAFYSNMGVLPLHILFGNAWNQYFFSVHAIGGLWLFQAFLFAIAAIAAVCLLLGYHTRLATFISWLLLLSLHNRNPLITQSGDSLLRMLLFWGMFLPWHRHYSLDAARAPERAAETSTSYFSAATAAYLLQVAWVYVFTALLKTGPEWRVDGTALYYALSIDQVLMPGGRILYRFPELMKFLTHATFLVEMWLPFVLLIPWKNTWFRMLFIITIIGLHIGISLTLFVGLFYLISISAVMGLIPTPVMDRLDRGLRMSFAKVRRRWGKPGYTFRSPLRLQMNLEWRSPKWASSLKPFREGIVVSCLIIAFWWNLSTLDKPRIGMPTGLEPIALVLRLDQNWSMFAPSVFKDDGWYILEGKTNTNHLVDLNRQGKEPDYSKPASVVSLFKNDRWRKYGENYLFVSNEYMRPFYCFYLLRRWNEDHPKSEQIKELNVIYMKEVSLPDYKTAPVQREVLCNCMP